MIKFQYRAVTRQGAVVKGILGANTLQDLESKLSQDGLWLVKAHETAKSTGSSQRVSGKVDRELAEFAISMNGLMTAGVPLLDALGGVVEHTVHPGLKAVLSAMWKKVESGGTLHAAMAEHPNVFPTMVVNLVQAGEESGTLPEIFFELHRYLEWMERMKGDVRQATLYPAMVLLAVCGLLVLLFTFVIPQFIPVLESLEIQLPWLTDVMFRVSETMVATWWLWSLLLVAGPLTFIIVRSRVPKMVWWIDKGKLHLPVFGGLLQMLALSRFTHNFAMLARSGISVLDCLHLCQGVVGNRVMAHALGETEQAVKEGRTLSESLGRHAVFPPLFIQMVSVGERSGKLEQTMSKVAAFYSEEIPRRVKKMFGVLEPLLTLALISIVGTVALAIFLPILTLMGGIR